MARKGCAGSIVLLVVVGLALAAENYVDYRDEVSDKISPGENLRELYKLLIQRNALDEAGFAGLPLEHFMTRKSQRSPSLRLRFGRSGPHVSAGILARPMAPVAAYDDN